MASLAQIEQILGFCLKFAKAWGQSKVLSLWRSTGGSGESDWSRNGNRRWNSGVGFTLG